MVEIESFHLLTIKCQSATGCQPLAKVLVTAKNDRASCVSRETVIRITIRCTVLGGDKVKFAKIGKKFYFYPSL